MEDFSKTLAGLSPEKLAILAERNPLSFGQQRLWFLDQLSPGSAFYTGLAALRLSGSLNVAALQHTFTEIVRRHEILRTSFPSAGSHAIQVVHQAKPIALPVIDLSHLDDEKRESESILLARAEAARPFNLATGPLMRLALVQLAEQDDLLFITMHHIISDRWSFWIFIEEMAALYGAFSDGRPSPLQELPIQFIDYAAWQRDWLQGEVLEAQLAYWKNQLSGIPLVLQLDTDRPRPRIQSFRGARFHFDLPLVLIEALGRVSRQQGATLFMTMLAAFNVLLHRYTNQDDIVIGTPIANRNKAETERLIGILLNSLPLRTNMAGNPTFRQLIDTVREVALGAYSHQDLPFERLVEELELERTLSHNPIFQVMFSVQNNPSGALELPGFTVTPMEVAKDGAKFDLYLSVENSEQTFRGVIEYATDLFDRQRIERMAEHYVVLLEAMTVDPDQPILELPLLTLGERRLLVSEFNLTQVNFPKEACVHHLFETQAARTPRATAVTYHRAHLSYDELNRKANQLARRLQQIGAGPESLVALCLERGLDMVVGVLAILKAGAAYVPVDPAFPQQRIVFMLEDARPKVLLTQSSLCGLFHDFGDRIILLDEEWDEIGEHEDANLEMQTSAGSLAYVLYTSGSTGKPKGVEIAHRSVVNLLEAMSNMLSMTSDGVFLAITTLSFDISAAELYLPLATGARIEVLSREEAADGAALLKTLVESNITLMQATPTTWQLLVDAGWNGSPELTAICGGEALSFDLARRLLERTRALWNLYGPTETTVWSMARRVRKEDDLVLIGRPIDNTQVYVLDERMQPQPKGIAGELYIGGLGVARGYHNRVNLTAERFVPDAFGDEPGGRLYRTGDSVRHRNDGIEYLGRTDHQVKLRGYRIEMGEIEAALREFPSVREAVVVLSESDPLDKRLVAYIVPERQFMPATGELRAYLKRSLPDYMVPAIFVIAEDLPLTPNGKLDRKQLLTLDAASGQFEEGFVLPRTPVEEVLCGIWSQVLNVERVGVMANFFDLGGHSLRATQVASRIRESLGIELPVRNLFECPTVRELAERIQQRRSAGKTAQPPALKRGPGDGLLPLSFAQQRLWFLDQLESDNPAYNLSMGLRLQGSLDQGALEHAFAHLVERHEVLRTRFESRNGAPAQVIDEKGESNLSIIDLSRTAAPAQEAEEVIKREVTQGFDLNRGPLLRVRVIKLNDNEHLLLVVLHHIIADGWSLGLLLREIVTAYQSRVTGRVDELEELLPVQYADYAVWQREWLSGEVLAEGLGYWHGQLNGAPEVLEVGKDRARPAEQSYRGGKVRMSVSKELVEKVKRLCRTEGVTMYMMLLAAFEVLLGRHSGEEEVVVGSVTANRRQVEVEGLIGFFANTVALRASLGGRATVREVLRRVRESALGAYEHEEVPFEKVVEALHPERRLSHAPLFQAMFVLQNAAQLNVHHIDDLELTGLKVSPIEIEKETTLFDLMLLMTETEEGLQGSWTYSTDLFDRPTIERMAGHFKVLLEAMVSHPTQYIDDLPLLTSAEREQLLVEWNDTRVDYGKCDSLHGLFERQAERTPDAIALVCDEQKLTYGELNTRANQLAHHLRAFGVGPETLVGVCMRRNREMIVALLAVLKSGGAYLPLDPAYPKERLAFILSETRAIVLLTEECMSELLPQNDARLVCVDTAWSEIDGESRDNPHNLAGGNNLAYVIYTSGSTGKPKGVAIEHHSAGMFIQWAIDAFSAEELSAVLASTSICFDLSVFEIFAPLSAGGKLILAENALHLPALAAANEVTLVNTVPSAIAELVRAGALPPSVKTVNLAGEALQRPLVQQIYELPGIAAVVNLYGPSEDTTYSTFVRLDKNDSRTPPIGRPIANTQVYLLDRSMQLVPAGVAGEVYIGGEGLARGYLNSPEQTADRFCPNPFSGAPGGRMYRTGDIARYLADGNLDYIGRSDHQVKIRGFRIELGEIESRLAGHSSVRDAVVIARTEESGDKNLVAYYTVNEGHEVGIDELRRFVSETLPPHMIPQFFVALESLPLTPNGKLDRKSLVAPGRTTTPGSFVAARNPAEKVVAGVWADVLNLEHVSVQDNFFELGGHSLLATQVISRLRETFRVDLPLSNLFKMGTIEGVVNEIVRAWGDAEVVQQIARTVDEVEQLSADELSRMIYEENAVEMI